MEELTSKLTLGFGRIYLFSSVGFLEAFKRRRENERHRETTDREEEIAAKLVLHST